MSQIVPPTFDPFATHPFTNNSGVPPQAPQPYPYPRPIRSAHIQTAPPGPSSDPSSSSSSLPTKQTPMHSPQPQRAASNASANVPSSRQHVFEAFRLDRSSPDLQDVLAKKSSTIKPKGDSKTKAK